MNLLIKGIVFASAICTTNVPVERQNSPSKWKVAFNENALKWGADERMTLADREIIGINTVNFRSDGDECVAWDQGKVIEAGSKRIYSKEFGPCIAVLARGYKENSDTPTHLALHHVFHDTLSFQRTLSKLIGLVQRGEIEVFISGGDKTSKDKYREILKIINKSSTGDCRVVVQDDTFSIADVGTPAKYTKDGYFPMSLGISYTGFTSDEQINPVQVIFLRDAHDSVSDSEVIQLIWE